MKIVHLNTTDFGGAAIAAVQLHLALLSKGHESHFLSLVKTRNDIPNHHSVDGFLLSQNPYLSKIQYKLVRLLEKSKLKEDHSTGSNNRYLQGLSPQNEIFSLPYSYFDILQHPKVHDADIIHLHWVSRGMIDYKRFFENVKAPVIWTLHDMNAFTGGCHHSDDCTKYESDCPTCPQLVQTIKPNLSHQIWRYKREALSHNSQPLVITTPSIWLQQCVQRSSLMKSLTSVCIPNAINTSIFKLGDKTGSRTLLGLPTNKKIILFNAYDTESPRKGMPSLIKCLEDFSESVVIVAIGNCQLTSVGQHELITPGYIQDSTILAHYYNAADVFVLPSLAENFPNTICEAHLCGLPVIASEVGGIPEQIDPSNGILTIPNDHSSISKALRRVLEENPFDRLTISTQAHHRYNRDLIVSKFISVYQNQLSS